MTYQRKGYQQGADRHNARLKMSDVEALRRGDLGHYRQAAKTLGVTHVTAWYALTGRNWKSCTVPPVSLSEPST